ncbi:uncharacterized protein LOC144452349 [Glandiceps talaboti]
MPNEAATTVAQVMYRNSGEDVSMDSKQRSLDSEDVVPVDQQSEESVNYTCDPTSVPNESRAHTDSDSDGESSSGSTSAGARRGVPPHLIKVPSELLPYPSSVFSGVRHLHGRQMRPFTNSYTATREMLSYAAGLGASGLHPYAALSIGFPSLTTLPPGMTPGLAPHLMTLATEAAKMISPTQSLHLSHKKRKHAHISPSSSSPNVDKGASGDTLLGTHVCDEGMDSTDVVIPPVSSSTLVSSSPSISTTNSSNIPDFLHVTNSCDGRGKKRRSLPDELKDGAYWERRRKNNEAAKRSRDARKAKEEDVAIRAALLEQENYRLRVEVAALKEETARLRCLLYNS